MPLSKGEDSPDPSPIREEEFNLLMKPYESVSALALAVSGGADSMALLDLVWRWRRLRAKPPRLNALIVDHALRPEAAEEARITAAYIRSRTASARHTALNPIILRDRSATYQTALQARARDARYRLMTEWCRRTETPLLMLAHHLEDQAETFLLRLAHGSGLDGLAAMASSTMRENILLARPLLPLSRARLRAHLCARGMAWLEDPSNQNTAFERVRIRRHLPRLEEEGFSPQRLAAAAKHAEQSRNLLWQSVEIFLARHATGLKKPQSSALCRLKKEPLQNIHEEIALRALQKILMSVGDRTHAPRTRKLRALLHALCARNAKSRTLAKCLCIPQGADILFIPEAESAAPSRRAS